MNSTECIVRYIQALYCLITGAPINYFARMLLSYLKGTLLKMAIPSLSGVDAENDTSYACGRDGLAAGLFGQYGGIHSSISDFDRWMRRQKQVIRVQ